MIDPFGFVVCHRPRSAVFGKGTVQYQYSTVEDDVVAGEHCVIGSNVYVGKGTVMGDNVRIQHGAFITRHSQIGNRVFIGPNVSFTDDRYPKVNHPLYEAEPPILMDDCSIGAGAVICPGVKIGYKAVVGAGAVVTKDVADGETVVGVPAYPLRHTTTYDVPNTCLI